MGATGVIVGTQLLGTAISVGAQQEAAQFNAAIARRNQRLAKMQAKDAFERGRRQEGRVRQLGRRTAAGQRAALASQGVVVDTGTAVNLREDIDRAVETDVRTLRTNAALAAWGFENQMQDFALQAQLGAREAAFGQTTTILGGALDIARTLRD
jgi:hypothetical protein